MKRFFLAAVLCSVATATWGSCVSGNCSNGWGTYTFADGQKYVGEFKDGRYHGQGTFTFTDGRKYVGEFKDGRYHGQATVTWSDGQKYVGQFKDDNKHGQGTHTWPGHFNPA